MPFISAQEMEEMTSKGHLAAEQPGAAAPVVHSFPYSGHHPHHHLCHMGRATQSCRAAGVFAGEIISPPNRQEAHAVGVGGGGFQNTTNRYSPLSNDTAALPVPVSVGTSSASHPERAGDIHICPQGAWTGGDGSSGTSCSLFWGLR